MVDKNNYKECAVYKINSHKHGNSFYCKYDPRTQIAIDKHFAGMWCGACFDVDTCEEVQIKYKR